MRLHQDLDRLDLLPLLPAGTTGRAWLVREGRTVGVHSERLTLPQEPRLYTLSLPVGWRPVEACLLWVWQWDRTSVGVMQWERWGNFFRAGSTPAAPQPGTRVYLSGSWMV
nr:hypothetical protein [Actinomyces sp.]